MDETDLSKELKDFYEKNKKNKLILSTNEILEKINGSFFSIGSDYEKDVVFKKYINEIIFGFKTGICFTKNSIIFKKVDINFDNGKITEKVYKYTFNEIDFQINIIREHPTLKLKIGEIIKQIGYTNTIRIQYIELINQINSELFYKFRTKIKIQNKLEEKRLKELQRLREEKRLKELQVSQTTVFRDLDKDGNGEVDVTEGNEFNLLLKKHQKKIVEVDRNYVQQFVKVSSYLRNKKGNIQFIFNSIKDTPNHKVLNEYVDILKDEIHTYNLILFNSLNMIVSLVEDDMITFYEIHEMFDTLNMFDSKHEKDVSQRLKNIGDGLESLMYEIRDMGNRISDSLYELSYVTEQSNQQLMDQLNEIDSSIETNNLLTSIQTYQTYKVNKNTKGLRE